MADYTITASSVVPSAAAVKSGNLLAGESVTPGMPLYVKTSDGRLYKADANASAETSTVVGICLSVSAAGQPCWYASEDAEFEHGTSNNTGGTTSYLSATAGGICPVGDLAPGMYPVTLMTIYGDDTNFAALKINAVTNAVT